MTDDQPTATPDAPDTPAPDAAAADNGLAGLDDRARRLVERANSEAAAFRHELQQTRQTLEGLQRKHESEQERRDREAEERGRASVEPELTAARREALAERIKARAASRFADVDDVVLYLDLDGLAAQDPGRRDQAIDKALQDLLERKPHLAPRQQTGVLISQGSRSQQPTGRPRDSWLRRGL